MKKPFKKPSMYTFLFFLWFTVYFVFGSELFAFGRKEIEEVDPINTEWALTITTFDASALSPAWQTAGDTVTRNLADALSRLDFRSRGEEETAHYRDYAWTRARAAAADALSKKRDERDMLFFKGEPEWKYQKDLAAIEAEILLLEEELALVIDQAPVVEAEPVFMLVEENLNGVFPLPPEPGGENRFCARQNVDAFISGNLSEYYGRILLDIKMYTRYTGSYSYQDTILFSYEDFHTVLDEISNRLVIAVSDSVPSAALVHVTPPDADLFIDGVFTAPGETGVFPPGTVDIAVQAERHIPAALLLELNAGEFAELFIDLTPLGASVFQAESSHRPGSKVYLGSLYVGETPLTLELPRNEFSYISVETEEGEIASVIYRDNAIVGGSAAFVRQDDTHGSADFITAMPLLEEEKRVSTARNTFYKAYGAAWFVLPAALILTGIANTYITANNYVVSNNLYGYDSGRRSRIQNSASTANLVTTVAYGAIGASLGAVVFQAFRYVRASGAEPTPLVRVLPSEEPVLEEMAFEETMLEEAVLDEMILDETIIEE